MLLPKNQRLDCTVLQKLCSMNSAWVPSNDFTTPNDLYFWIYIELGTSLFKVKLSSTLLPNHWPEGVWPDFPLQNLTFFAVSRGFRISNVLDPLFCRLNAGNRSHWKNTWCLSVLLTSWKQKRDSHYLVDHLLKLLDVSKCSNRWWTTESHVICLLILNFPAVKHLSKYFVW